MLSHGARCFPGGVQGRRHPSRLQGVRHADDGGNLLPEDQWKVSHQPAASEFTFRHSWEVFLIPQGFSLITQKWRRTAPPFFLYNCSDIFSEHFVKILAPGHLRSGDQVRSSDPTSKKVCDRVTVTVIERMFRNF